MESYVTGRHQAVLIDGYVSSHVPLRYGVASPAMLPAHCMTLFVHLVSTAISSPTTPNSTNLSGFGVV
jgi:hypothetical protein